MEITLVVCSHGKLAEGLIDAAEMIFGKLENCYAIELKPEYGFEQYQEMILRNRRDQKSLENIFYLVDIYGATPFNTVLSVMEETKDHQVIYGINLPLFIELLALRNRVESYLEFQKSVEEIVIQAKDTMGFTSLNSFLS